MTFEDGNAPVEKIFHITINSTKGRLDGECNDMCTITENSNNFENLSNTKRLASA